MQSDFVSFLEVEIKPVVINNYIIIMFLIRNYIIMLLVKFLKTIS